MAARGLPARSEKRKWDEGDRMPKTIVIPVTLDTKGEETGYVMREIERKGHNTIVIDVGVWDPVCGKRRVTDSGCAYYPKIYGDVVVWMDARNGSADIYMTPMLACCGDPEHPYPVGDLNGDCRVDLLDLAILSSHWLECTQPVSD